MFDTAAQILAAPASALFPGDDSAVTKAFRSLVTKWHPDRCKDPQANEVFEYLMKARDKALGRAPVPSVVLQRVNGTKFKMEYMRETVIEGMRIFTGATSIAYLVDSQNNDLLRKNGSHRWRFANKDMEKEMIRFLPLLVRKEELVNGTLIIYRRRPSQILMSDLMALNGERISPIQVSWMVTRMGNIACYLEWAGLVHYSMHPEFLLVDLDSHGVSLIGPPIYMTKVGERPVAVPSRTLSAIPSIRNSTVKAETAMDRQIIRETALALLGDRSGNRIKSDPAVRSDVAKWVSSPPAKTAVADYETWEHALGPRKFVPYGKSAREIYA